MNRQDIQLLHPYNNWANARILDAASSLSPGDIDLIVFLREMKQLK